MRPHPGAERQTTVAVMPRRSTRERVLLVLWPAFLMAGVLEMMLFAVVDPSSLEWFGVEPIGWSRNAVYSVTFFIFWAVISVSAFITMLLDGLHHHAARGPGPPFGRRPRVGEAPGGAGHDSTHPHCVEPTLSPRVPCER
jgi:hypothetical protein